MCYVLQTRQILKLFILARITLSSQDAATVLHLSEYIFSDHIITVYIIMAKSLVTNVCHYMAPSKISPEGNTSISF